MVQLASETLIAGCNKVGPCRLPDAWMLLYKARAEESGPLQVHQYKEQADWVDLTATRCERVSEKGYGNDKMHLPEHSNTGPPRSH